MVDVRTIELGRVGPRRGRWQVSAALGGLVLVSVTCVAYSPALRCGFVWDDPMYLTENRIVQSASGLPAIWSISWDGESGTARIQTPQYYPLVFTTFWIEHRLWGLQPIGYHLVNLLLHAINAMLVWAVARTLRIPGAWFIGAAFALHPVHVESVAWVTERKNVLSGLFALLTLLAYLRFDEGKKPGWYIAALLLFVAALFSKTAVAPLPVVILLAVFYRNRRLAPRDVLAMLPLLLIGAALGLTTAYLERVNVGARGVGWEQTFLERTLIIAPSAFCFYAGKIAWPHPLIFIYPRWPIDAADWVGYLPLGGLLVVCGGLVLIRRRTGWGPLLLVACSAVMLFPALGFFNVYWHRFSWVADHFQYLGSLGFITLITVSVICVGRGFLRPAGQSIALTGLAVVILALMAGKTFWQSRSYEDAVRLWEDTLERNPDAWLAALNLGEHAAAVGRKGDAVAYFERAARNPVARGETYGGWGNVLLQAGRHDEAIVKYHQALALGPPDARTYGNLGLALMMAGRLDEAVEVLESAVRSAPMRERVWLSLGLVYASQDRNHDAARCLRRAVELKANSPLAFTHYGGVLTELGRYDEAAQQYRAALALQPTDSAAARGLVTALYRQAKYEEALDTCRTALARIDNSPGLLATQAWMVATCPDDAIRDGERALGLAKQAVEAGARGPYVLDALAAASAELGHFAEAVTLAEKALKRARRNRNEELAAAIEQRLALYRDRQPYRGPP